MVCLSAGLTWLQAETHSARQGVVRPPPEPSWLHAHDKRDVEENNRRRDARCNSRLHRNGGSLPT